MRFFAGGPSEAAPRRPGFSDCDLRELRGMAECHARAEVRQAAAAVLHYARGGSLKSSAAGTPYGAGWVRGLLAALKAGGVRALAERDYRRARSG